MIRVLVVGGGNGGFATAADLAIRGCEVRVYNRTPQTLEAVAGQGGIRYSGVLGEGLAQVRVGADLGALVDDVDLIVVCLPATAHAFAARALAPHLHPEQAVLLNPGGLLGSLAFCRDLRDAGYRDPLLLGETGTLTYICRKTDPGGVRVTSILRDVPTAAFPGRSTAELLRRAQPVLAGLMPQPTILHSGLANVNAVLHPPGMLLGAAWIEHTGGDFSFYYDGATPAVGRLLAALDRERLAVARAWGVEVPPFPVLFARIGSTTAEAAASGDYVRILRESAPNREIKAPPSLEHRYMHEDIPMGVVPLADLGRAAGVATEVLDAVITLASTITGRNYRREGRTLAGVGMGGWTVDRVRRVLEDGEGWAWS